MSEHSRSGGQGAVRVSFLPQAREAEIAPGQTVIAAASDAEVAVETPCGGAGLCGGCAVRFIEGAPAAGPWDRLHFQQDELDEGCRLACTARPTADAIVSSPRGSAPIRLDGRTFPYRLAPPAQRARIRASADSLTRETESILPAVALGARPRELTLHVLDGRLRDVELGWSQADYLGAAAVVEGDWLEGWLLDLTTGDHLAATRSRLIGGRQAADEAPDSVAAAVRRLVRALCLKASRRPEHVRDVVIVAGDAGNERDERTAPRLAGGRDPQISLSAAAAVASGLEEDLPTLLVALDPHPWVMAIHGDRACVAPAAGWQRDPRLFAPPGTQGAVEHATLLPSVELGYRSGPPRALTVSGALDCVAQLRSANLLDHRGTLSRESADDDGPEGSLRRRIGVFGGKRGFLVWGEPESTGALVLRHDHIRSLQRLRAVLHTATNAALLATELPREEVRRVVLADEQSASLGVRNGIAVGLLPDLSPAVFETHPRAAGAGARLALLSSAASRDLEALAARCVRRPGESVGREWARGLYLTPQEQSESLDGSAAALLDFGGRESGPRVAVR